MMVRLLAVLAGATVADAYRFMAIGDWGASYTPPSSRKLDTCEIDPEVNCSTHGVSGCGYNEQQQMDGLQMGKFAAANKVDHVMLLGDNFYGSGIHGDDTSCRFKKTFEDIYNASSLMDVPFYAIAGNVRLPSPYRPSQPRRSGPQLTRRAPCCCSTTTEATCRRRSPTRTTRRAGSTRTGTTASRSPSPTPRRTPR